MGMDIVRVAVDELGGEVREHARGRGTTFTLRVPLTISIVDVLLVRGRRAALRGARRDGRGDRRSSTGRAGPSRAAGERSGRGLSVRAARRGGAGARPAGRLLLAAKRPAAEKALLVRRGGEPIAFAVDRMLGQQEVVLRPLEDPLVKKGGIAGATDLGDGQPTLGPRPRRPRRRGARRRRDGVRRVSALHVVFKVGTAEYAMPAADVLQMESYTGATPVPGAAAVRRRDRPGARPRRPAARSPRALRAARGRAHDRLGGSSSDGTPAVRWACSSTARARCSTSRRSTSSHRPGWWRTRPQVS